MQSAIKIKTKVLPGNKVEIQVPPGSEGEEVEVFVVLPERPQTPQQNVLEILEEIHKHGTFRTIEEIDRDLQIERESWDS
ncbi:MAG: hypothetical protein SVX43_11480 [Cyanobacteriota bacterium]|nr:hypothetical protein [Cyanobacteriota bacterium]